MAIYPFGFKNTQKNPQGILKSLEVFEVGFIFYKIKPQKQKSPRVIGGI
jgi:hypothetical protein